MFLFNEQFSSLAVSPRNNSRYNLYVCVCTCYAQLLSGVRLFAVPWTIAGQTPLSMEFSRQEDWSGLPIPTPGDRLEPGIELTFLVSPALAGGLIIPTI